MSLLVTACASVSVATLPLIDTPVTRIGWPSTLTVKALPSGAAPASASLNATVSVAPSTVVLLTVGATVSVVPLISADGPKLVVEFSVGTARSRIRSPAAPGSV